MTDKMKAVFGAGSIRAAWHCVDDEMAAGPTRPQMIESARHTDMADSPPEPFSELPSSSSAPPRRTFGREAARGFASTLTASLITKMILLGGQIVVAWYVSKRDLGLAATALAA